MNRTKIEWVKNPDGTQGYIWNPITGCLNGCEYCYARKLANGRLRSRYLANKNIAPVYAEGGELYTKANKMIALDPFYPRFWDRVLDQMRPVARWAGGRYNRKPKGVFVCDMSNLFGIGIPEEWTRKVLKVIEAQPTYRFYLLTKQPQNLIKFSPFPDNCWVGVTVTNWAMLLDALYDLSRTEATVRYISFEPLLEFVPIDGLNLVKHHINWIIIGAQTKPYKPPKIEWAEEIVEACDKAEIPVFLKDNLGDLIPINHHLRYGSAGELRLRQEMSEGR